MIKYIKILALTIACSLAFESIYACSCRERTLPVKFQDSHLVFQGTAIEVDHKDDLTTAPGSKVKFLFKIERIWKGNVTTQTVAIYSNASSAACGTSFELGKSYIIYASTSDTPNEYATYYTGLCQFNSLTNPEEVTSLSKLQKQKKR